MLFRNKIHKEELGSGQIVLSAIQMAATTEKYHEWSVIHRILRMVIKPWDSMKGQ